MNQDTMAFLRDYPELSDVLESRSLDREFEEDSRVFSSGKKIVERVFGPEVSGGYAVNVIPGGHPGQCRPVLFVGIGNSDDVGKRILEAIVHEGVTCPGRTTAVLFYATWWSGKDWAIQRAKFSALRVQCWLKMPFHDFVKLK